MDDININNMGFNNIEIEIKPSMKEKEEEIHTKTKVLSVIPTEDDLINTNTISDIIDDKPNEDINQHTIKLYTKKENKTRDMKAYRKMYNETNKDKIKQYREKAKTQKKEYYERNKEKASELAKKYRETHKEELKIKKEEKKAIYNATYRDKYNKIKEQKDKQRLLNRCIIGIYNKCSTAWDILHGERIDKNDDEVRFIKKDKSIKPVIQTSNKLIIEIDTDTDDSLNINDVVPLNPIQNLCNTLDSTKDILVL